MDKGKTFWKQNSKSSALYVLCDLVHSQRMCGLQFVGNLKMVASARQQANHALCFFCLCDVGADRGGREFFEQVAILNEAKHYMSGSASTHNARKRSPQLPSTLCRRCRMTRRKIWLPVMMNSLLSARGLTLRDRARILVCYVCQVLSNES
jgi:hypothetical protein